jgi:alpha-glucosidase
VFGGPAWTFDAEPGQYYSHAYLREQPDLDWRNPAMREAMLDVLRFWLDRGVDGFRVDALRQVHKDPELRDNPPTPSSARACRSTTRCCRSTAPTTTTSRPRPRWRS